ncbi:tetratricopeptide repeat protein [candidate division WOR-3 bacterium]|nr:tetratricopeptide repeat protein [candidate division WOR-3 bacterium]
MEILFLILSVFALIVTIIFGFLQVIVHLRRGDLKFLKRFPFVTISSEGDIHAKAVKKGHRRKSKRRSKRKILITFLSLTVLGIILLLTSTLFVQEAVAGRRRPIAVMVFKNRTGESSFNYLSEAIPNLLITNLEQSRYLRVMTWERMHDLLKAMGREEVKTIDEELGFELCRMDGIEVIVLGSFTKAGDMFVTDVKVLDVETKRLLQTTSSKGEGVASILKRQIDELSRDISRGVGLSERKIESTKLRITDVTTNSMDAYNYFLRGREDYEKFYYDDARKFLERAIELDSTFAVAHLYLALVYEILGNNIEVRNKTYERARTFSEKSTEKERLYIEACYASTIERDQEKKFRILKQMTAKYPNEKRAHFTLTTYYYYKGLFYEAIEESNKALELDPNFGAAINMLAYTYAKMGKYDAAIEYFKRYAAVSPGDANPFDSMGEIYFRMGLFDEAIAKFKEAVEVKPDFYLSYWKIAYLCALKEDYPEAMKWVDRFIAIAPSPSKKADGYEWRGFYHYWLGNLDQSLNDLQKATDVWESIGSKGGKAFVDWIRGWIYYDRGDIEPGLRSYSHWLNYRIENNPARKPFYTAVYSFYLGLVDLKQGQTDSAKSRVAEIKSLLLEIDIDDKDFIKFRYDLLNGEVLQAEKHLEQAIVVCEKASKLKIPSMYTGNILSYNIPLPKDVLARAYLQKGELDKAIAEYERLVIVDPKSQDRYLIHPKYHYLLAKVYEEKGLKEKAIEQYKRFLEIWKDADEDMPELINARMRLNNILK